jgi:hypothetical protein
MAELTLGEWAAVSEIFGMVAVVVSLLLVVGSTRKNTAAMHTADDNFLYQRPDLSEKHLESHGTAAEALGSHFVTDGHVYERVV